MGDRCFKREVTDRYPSGSFKTVGEHGSPPPFPNKRPNRCVGIIARIS